MKIKAWGSVLLLSCLCSAVTAQNGNHYLEKPLPTSNDRTKRLSLIESFTKKKLTRLEKFYKYGLSQAGWNKYSYINLEFDNQIICKRRSN